MKKSVFPLILLISLGFFGLASRCKPENKTPKLKPRDRKEQYLNNEKDSIRHFLETHSYVLDYNQVVHFVPLQSGQTPLIDVADTIHVQDTIADDLTYVVYYLDLNRGTGDTITTCDMVLMGTFIRDLKGNEYLVKDENNPVWSYVYSPRVKVNLYGLQFLIPKYRSGHYTVNGDGTVTFTDYGNCVVFLPSGLAQFNEPTSLDELGNNIIPSYTPLIVQFKTFYVNTDIDRDHVPNVVEDLNGDGNPNNDNTDKEYNDYPGNPSNYLDPDDDGDNVRTIDEDVNGNGDPTDDDTDGDGIPNYLDRDSH